ncbi:hypothetical protein MBLNU459_g0190t1 [Dothideomycetes sp. NU459]
MTAAVPSSNLHGLALSRSERIVVVALSYVWCTPLFVCRNPSATRRNQHQNQSQIPNQTQNQNQTRDQE